jgi:flagellar biosynthesis protein FlhB
MSQSQAGEKTERPTEKRLRDARRKGQVSKSQDLTSALLMLAAVVVFWLAGGWMAEWVRTSVQNYIGTAASFSGELDRAAALAALVDGAKVIGLALLPLLATLFAVAALGGYVQVGPIFAFESVKPNLNKLNPTEGFKQKFLKSRPYIELGKTLIKMTVAAVVIGVVLWSSRRDIIELMRQPALNVATYTLGLIFEIGLKVGLAYIALGAADFFLQRFLHLKEMRMTKQEVKQEWKETEGDPLYKSMRRQMHRDILSQSVLAAVREADVVVVNPTHLAVALRYDRAAMGAPTVVAKGAELMAARIRELARESNVPVMRDVPLARSLYELEIDAEIPDELFESVAVVLRWVYALAEERGEVTQRPDAAGQSNQPVGQPGPLGQPTGLPVPGAAGQGKVLPDVLAGRDPSQLVAAERMREAGGVSATDQLLGLNRQPPVIGAFAPPPGNSEALRHMTPTMRRAIMRGLLERQRGRMRRLARLVRDEHGGDGDAEEGERERDERGFADALLELQPRPDETQLARARQELHTAARLLDLLDELLAMQDYTVSQMGTFSQG